MGHVTSRKPRISIGNHSNGEFDTNILNGKTNFQDFKCSSMKYTGISGQIDGQPDKNYILVSGT